MVVYIMINFKVRAFNYGRMCFWQMLSLFGVLWVGLISTLDLLTAEHLAYVILLFVGWFSLVAFGVLTQNKCFPSRLRFDRHANLQGLYNWGFRPSKSVEARTDWFRSQVIYGPEDFAEGHPHHLANKIGRTNYTYVDQSSLAQSTNNYGISGMIIPEREMSHRARQHINNQSILS